MAPLIETKDVGRETIWRLKADTVSVVTSSRLRILLIARDHSARIGTNSPAPRHSIAMTNPENSERSATPVITRLQRGVLKIALAFQGQHETVDEHLRQLSRHIKERRTAADIQHIVDELVDAIVRLDPPRRANLPVASVQTRDHLLGMIGTLAVTPDRDAYVNELWQQTSAACTLEELVDCIEKLVSLLQDRNVNLNQEILELKTFLVDITQRLQSFKASLADAGIVHADTAKDSSLLSQHISSQLASLTALIGEEADLDELKALVTSNLQLVESGIEDFAAQAQARHSNANTELSEVEKKLAAFERETEKLRTALAEQQAQSLVDPLTGVLNRLGYSKALAREFARHRRYQKPLSLAIIDVDHFKNVNDRCGHAAGDKVLASVASLLQQNTRQCDHVARYGGDEFVIILPETSREDAEQSAEKLRARIATSRFLSKSEQVPITVSVGIAEFEPGDSVEAAFERADHTLYGAKQRGRNQLGDKSLGPCAGAVATRGAER